MTWKPDDQFDRLVTVAITGRRETMTQRQRRERQALDADLAHRGLINSGGRLTGHYKIDSDAFDEAAQGVIDDVIGLFRDVYGTIPLEATPWIREKLDAWLEGIATGIAQTASDLRRQLRVPGEAERPIGPLMKAKRRLDIELGKLELRARLKELTPPTPAALPVGTGADCFVCHASEDKDVAARPIADALRALGYSVWLDETELRIGDRLLDKIDEGLANCRFGIVVVSPGFFGKNWTRRELAGLVAREDAEDRTIILPVWLDVDEKVIAKHLPSLAGVLAAKLSDGVDRVVQEIVRAMGLPAK